MAEEGRDRSSALREAEAAFRGRAWDELIALGAQIEEPLDELSASLADKVAFGLGMRKREGEGIVLLERAWAFHPTYRRASTLAYLHYAMAMRDEQRDPGKREAVRDGFRHWIAEALRREPRSVKDLYRLGVFEAQIEARHDAVALRAFAAALESYRALGDQPERQRPLDKYATRTLYAAARSALRLGKARLARRYAFDCIRSDERGRFIARTHQLGIAGKACLAVGELEHAERAFRLALDADGPPRRDYLYGHLSEVSRRRGDLDAACRWIEEHTRPERRSAALWRRLGELEIARERLGRARHALKEALRRDRGGKHLTLTLVGHLHLAQGERREAERSFRDADRFRRRRYQSRHVPALRGLALALDARGRADAAEATRREIDELVDRRPGLAKGRRPPSRPEAPGQAAASSPELSERPRDDSAAPNGKPATGEQEVA